MRTTTLSVSALALLVLMGAGCAQTAPTASNSVTDSYGYNDGATPVVPDTQPTQPATPDLAASSTSIPPQVNPTSTTAMPSPATLAFPGVLPAQEVNKNVRIKTNHGDIVVQVSGEMGPNAASNFVYLVKQGFYNGTIFHRVIPGFMIQGGDPTGTGMGGPGYQFANDPVKNMPTKTIRIQGQTMTAPVYEDGWLAMANAGRNTNGSQFFIMVGDYPLPPDYSVFGKVVTGLDVAHKIADLARDGNDRPNTEVKMISVTVE